MAQFGTVGIFGNTKKMPKKIRNERSRAWCFTFNNYEFCDVAQLTDYFDEHDIEYVFQEEMESTPHLQGVLRFKNPRSMLFQRDLSERIHWERCRSWKLSVKYCTKRDTRVGNVYSNIEGLKWRKTIIDPLLGKELYSWQQEVIDIVSKEPDERRIYWIWDPVGNTGKSSLCKHLVLRRGAIIVGGRCRDAEYAIMKILEERDPEIVCFDIPRSQFNHISYAAIESIKNGMFFSSKYESGQCVFNTPHVLVFCNYEPDYSRLSADRWVTLNAKTV